MIIKVIANTIASSIEKRVQGLSDYIHHPKQTRSHHLSTYIHQLHPGSGQDFLAEKCMYSNSRNFLDDDPDQQKIEMSQMASLNSRVTDPIQHIVGSFKKFEVPTTEQIEEQIDILVKHLGAEDLQMQYAMHVDTDNVHFHLILNKVHPFKKNKQHENKVIDLGEGWILNAVHRAVAEIEAKQGWESEPNPLFIYNHHTQQCEKNPHHFAQLGTEKIHSKIRDQQHRHQQKSQISTEIESGKDYQCYIADCVNQVLKSAKNWQDWHTDLARRGILYQPIRKGALFKIRTSEQQELTFKASLFCHKQATLKNLEKSWGEFRPHADDHIKAISGIKLDQSSAPAQSTETTLHSYHLFKNEDFLVKDLHDAYLKIKAEKDCISKSRKNEYQDISFENEIYQHNKAHFLKTVQQQFPEQSSDVIFTLLHYHHHTDQINARALQRERYKAQHQSLTQAATQTLQKSLPFSTKFDSSKISSYADFLKCFTPSHHLLMQQQFLFDQRQSKNFIRQDNPEIKTAKIIFDQYQPNEAIAIQNQYGIMVFSNYSIPRLQQCIKALDAKQAGKLQGSPEFKALFSLALQDRAQNIEDINKHRALPRLEGLSQTMIESCFTELFKSFTATHASQSTAIIKSCLLLNCCGVPMQSLQSTFKNCVAQHRLPNLTAEDQDILLLRVRNLLFIQPKALNKQYFNSSEIEHCWQLYFSLHISPLQQSKQQPRDLKSNSTSLALELALVPKMEKQITIRLPEHLAEADFMQMLQYFEYSRRVRLQKKQQAERLNTLQSTTKMAVPAQQSKMVFLAVKKYVIEYKFGQKFYLDQKKIAFFETKNAAEIVVLSQRNEHVHDALLLAKAKFGVVLVSGTDAFKTQVQQLADSAGIKIEFEPAPQQKANAAIEQSPASDDSIRNERSQATAPTTTTELSLEPRDTRILNKEERASNFYNNQAVTSRGSSKESTPENNHDYRPGF